MEGCAFDLSSSSCQMEEVLSEEEQKIKQEQDALTLDMEKLWGFVERAQQAYQKVVFMARCMSFAQQSGLVSIRVGQIIWS